MSMVLKAFVIFVRDMDTSRNFYQQALGQVVMADHGQNVVFTSGLSIWEAEHRANVHNHNLFRRLPGLGEIEEVLDQPGASPGAHLESDQILLELLAGLLMGHVFDCHLQHIPVPDDGGQWPLEVVRHGMRISFKLRVDLAKLVLDALQFTYVKHGEVG
ncbi:MAG TPA: hypothetical protein VIK22_08830 [Candidatus Anoxymicrobiaceae bacterium]